MENSIKKYRIIWSTRSKEELKKELEDLYKEHCFFANQYEKSTTNEAKRHYRKCIEENTLKLDYISEKLD